VARWSNVATELAAVLTVAEEPPARNMLSKYPEKRGKEGARGLPPCDMTQVTQSAQGRSYCPRVAGFQADWIVCLTDGETPCAARTPRRV
jgi:hypothetical protein